jgi:hypothetical protein
VRDFCAIAVTPASPLSGKVDNVWLEFDIAAGAGAGGSVPVPSSFFGSQQLRSDQPLDWFTECALPTLYGVHLSPEVEARVLACIRAVPPEGMVFQTGAMMSRQPPFVRLCLTNFGMKRFGAFLDTIGWPGNRDMIEAWTEDLSHFVDYVCLDIDVSETVGQTVGLECYFQPRRAPQYEPRWYPFLDFLAARGLLTEAKRAALVAYAGFVHEKSPGAAYPDALLNASNLLGPNYYSSILRGPHHVKIVLRGEQVEAKGYLYVEHYWLNAQDMKKSGPELATPRHNL